MDGAIYVAVGGVLVAFLNFVVNPWVQAKLNRAKEADPLLGWQIAFKTLETQQKEDRERIIALEKENNELEHKVATLQSQMSDKNTIIARQERLLRDAGRMIEAFQLYLQQIRELWRIRHPGEELPTPGPETAYWMNYDPTGGT